MTENITPPKNMLIASPRDASKTHDFLRDWDKLSPQDIHSLKEVMLLLTANDAPLPPEWEDCPLKCSNDEIRLCRVNGDLLLMYQIDSGTAEGITFLRAGTHSELFR